MSEDNEPKVLPYQIIVSKSDPENIYPFSYNGGFYSSMLKEGIKNSDSLSSDDEEKESIARIMNKNRIRGN